MSPYIVSNYKQLHILSQSGERPSQSRTMESSFLIGLDGWTGQPRNSPFDPPMHTPQGDAQRSSCRQSRLPDLSDELTLSRHDRGSARSCEIFCSSGIRKPNRANKQPVIAEANDLAASSNWPRASRKPTLIHCPPRHRQGAPGGAFLRLECSDRCPGYLVQGQGLGQCVRGPRSRLSTTLSGVPQLLIQAPHFEKQASEDTSHKEVIAMGTRGHSRSGGLSLGPSVGSADGPGFTLLINF